MAKPPERELGQIGPKSNPRQDAAALGAAAADMADEATVAGVSYEKMSSSPPARGHSKPNYDAYKHKGRDTTP